jgi:D-inositol-3-phosphate glycosyltransferase
MKILLVAHYYWPHIGGMEVVVEKQAKSLVERGHQVTIVTCRPDRHAPRTESKDGYSIERIPALNFIENTFGVTFPIIGPWVLLRLLRLVRAHDIVHIHDVFYMSSHFAALACVLQGKHFFLTQHVAMVDHPRLLVMVGQRLMYGTIGQLLFRQAQKIVSYNHTVRQFLIAQGIAQDNLVTHYNGIDTTYFHPVDIEVRRNLRQKYGLPLDRPIVLFVGRLVPKKGYDIVYKARSKDYFTLIVGAGRRPDYIVSDDDVKLFGPASSMQLKDLYAISDVFAFPAIGEIFTLVMQEAMASGLPVVTTDDPGYKSYDFSRKHIRLVARNSSALRSALQQITADTTRQNESKTYVREFALNNFDWQHNYDKEYSIYGLESAA